MIGRVVQTLTGCVLFAAFCWYIRPRRRFHRRRR